MNKGLLLIWFCLATLTALGQTDKRYIEVLGSAESEITPNIIVISIRLKEYEENKEKVILDKIETDFMSAVAKSKIAKENVQISDITVNAFQQRRRDRDFYSQKTYEVSFSKTEDVIVFLGNLKSVKIENLRISKLSHTEIEKYRLELKIQALKAAERKAEALLNSVGTKRGKPLLIEEKGDFSDWDPREVYANEEVKIMEYQSMVTSDIPLKKIKLRFEILARFEME